MNGDPRAFKQIALNLVANAIKFTGARRQRDGFRFGRGARLMLRVTDTGVDRCRGSRTDRRSVLPAGKIISAIRARRPRPVDREGLVDCMADERRACVGEGTTVAAALPLDLRRR
jgi:cell cycle sensor histidine kinase DivJ